MDRLVDAVVDALESVGPEQGPGELFADEPTVRVFVEDPEHVPPGHITYRDGPLYYYEEPLVPEEIGSLSVPPVDPFDINIYEKADGGEWIPYRGPQGGEGWQNANTGEVRYQQEPPGEPMHPNDVVDFLEEQGIDVTPDELVDALERAGEAVGVETPETFEMPDRERVERMAELAEEYNADNVDLAEAVNDAIEQEMGRLDPDEWAEVHNLVMREAERPGGEPTEGDVVRAKVSDADGVRVVEGEVVLNDGDWLVVEDHNGRERTFDLDEVETEILEEGEPLEAFTGERHPEPVEPDAGDVAQALNDIYGDDVESAFWAHRRLASSGANMEDILRDTFHDIDVGTDRDVEQTMKVAERPARFADNSAPEHLDPARAEEVVDILEVTDGSSTADAMDVARMPDGSEVYITHLDPSTPAGSFHQRTASPRDAEIQVASTEALRAMGLEAPDAHYEHNRFLAVEDAGGYSASKARRFYEMSGDLDEDTYNPNYQQVADTLAAQALIGNRDPHPGNFAVVERTRETDPSMLGGEVTEHILVPFDLDLAGHDTTNWDEHNNPMRKAGRTLKKVMGDSAPARVLAEEVEAAAQALADEIDLEAVLEATPDREMRETIRKNVEARRT